MELGKGEATELAEKLGEKEEGERRRVARLQERNARVLANPAT